jgi:hypothetical protein
MKTIAGAFGQSPNNWHPWIIAFKVAVSITKACVKLSKKK